MRRRLTSTITEPAPTAGTRERARLVGAPARDEHEGRAHDAAPRRSPTRTVLATARPMVAGRPGLADAARMSRWLLHVAPGWDHLLDDVHYGHVDAVLVDFDAIEREPHAGTQAMSGHRLIELLARASQRARFALVIQSARDFAEIEHLVRFGAHGLVYPQTSDEQVLAQVRAILARGGRCTRADLPVETGSGAEVLPRWLPRFVAVGAGAERERVAL